MGKSPAMPLYGKDAWSDEQFVAAPWDVQGLFWRLAFWQWMEGSIPADVARVIDVLGKPQSTRKLWPLVLRFFEPHPQMEGRLYNPTTEKHRAAMLADRARKQAGAEKTNAQRIAQRSDNDVFSERSAHGKERATRVANANAEASAVGFLESKPDPGIDSAAPPCSEAVRDASATVNWRTPPNAAVLSGWQERYGERLVLACLLERRDDLHGKHYAYAEPILLERDSLPRPVIVPRDPAGERLDAIREESRALRRKPEAREYLQWLAPDGAIREDALTFDEWKIRTAAV